MLVYGVQQMEAEGNGRVSPAASSRKSQAWEVRLAISPGVVLDSAAGVAASVRSGSYRVVTVPTVRHAAHLPLWADRAVLLGHFLSCPATTNSQSVSQSVPFISPLSLSGSLVLAGSTCLDALHVCMCSNLDSSLASSLSRCWLGHASIDGTVSLGNPLSTARDNRYCAVGDLHWV